MGFGQLQKSVWVSPHNFLDEFRNFLKSYQLEEKAILIETENLYVHDYLSLVYKLWPIKKINYQYNKIIKEIEGINSLKNSYDRIKKINKVKQKLMGLYFKDPNLPKELLPRNWRGDEVKLLIKKLKIF